MKLNGLWIGSNPVPTELNFMESWGRVNPNADVKLWNEGDALAALKKNHPEMEAVYHSMPMVGRVGILRFAIIEEAGGIYMDLDMECLKPFPKEWENESLLFDHYGWSHNDPIISDAVFGAAPRHPIWTTLLEECANTRVQSESRAANVWGIYVIGNTVGKFNFPFKQANFNRYTEHHNAGTWHNKN